MNNIKIVSGGQSSNTKVFCGDVELGFISRIDIDPIEIGCTVKATITFESVDLEMDAQMVAELKKIIGDKDE